MTPTLLLQGGNASLCAEKAFLTCIDENKMAPLLQGGVLLAFSGGADSVLLFRLLAAYTAQNNIPFAALHVNHGIRGEEAARDERFCRQMAGDMAVPFFSLAVDVPAYLAKEGKGESREEAARTLRYRAIEQFLAEHTAYAVCATAHHATDNLETVLFQIFRGAGLSGIAGIPPVRGAYVRPLLYLAKRDILAALDELGAPYVTDTTNTDPTLDRNYIRAELLPRIEHLRPDPEAAVTRLSANLREELSLRDELLDRFFEEHVEGGVADRAALLSLSPALRTRAVLRLYRESGGVGMPTRAQLSALFAREDGTRRNRRYDLAGGMRAVLEDGVFYILPRKADAPRPRASYELPLQMGCNPIGQKGEGELWLFPARNQTFEKEHQNVYKLLMQADLTSATMGGKLLARSRRAGDAYRTGGMTRIVRRLLSAAHLPQDLRELLPVVCDEQGILWVPGFGVRDAAKTTETKNGPYAYFCYGRKD